MKYSHGVVLILADFRLYLLPCSLGSYNLKRRLCQHKSGNTITTSKMSNPEVAYFEEFDNFNDARKRELYFKSAAGRRFLKNKLGS